MQQQSTTSRFFILGLIFSSIYGTGGLEKFSPLDDKLILMCESWASGSGSAWSIESAIHAFESSFIPDFEEVRFNGLISDSLPWKFSSSWTFSSSSGSIYSFK